MGTREVLAAYSYLVQDFGENRWSPLLLMFQSCLGLHPNGYDPRTTTTGRNTSTAHSHDSSIDPQATNKMTSTPVLILDNGAYNIKAGFSGKEGEPRYDDHDSSVTSTD
jgi:hypothetical protein